jgi:hypothetical protein
MLTHRALPGAVDPVHLDAEFLRQAEHQIGGVVAKIIWLCQSCPTCRAAGEEQVCALSGQSKPGLPGVFTRCYMAGSHAEHPEVQVPSAIDPSPATPGQHVASILVQYVPYHAAMPLGAARARPRATQSYKRWANMPPTWSWYCPSPGARRRIWRCLWVEGREHLSR